MRNAESFPFLIKVCGITNEFDAETALDAGAHALGFNFYPKSPRFISATRASQIIQDVGRSYLRVGIFVDPSEDELVAIAAEAALDVVQLPQGALSQTVAPSLRVWQSVPPTVGRDRLDRNVEAWLLDTPSRGHGGSGKTFDWSLASGFPGRAILAGGLDGSNVEQAIRVAQPWGVDACSRLESEPGRKDHARLTQFVQAALQTFEMREEIKT